MQRLQSSLVLLEDSMLIFALEVIMQDLVQGSIVDRLKQLSKLLSIRYDSLCIGSICVDQSDSKQCYRQQQQADMLDPRHGCSSSFSGSSSNVVVVDSRGNWKRRNVLFCKHGLVNTS